MRLSPKDKNWYYSAGRSVDFWVGHWWNISQPVLLLMDTRTNGPFPYVTRIAMLYL